MESPSLVSKLSVYGASLTQAVREFFCIYRYFSPTEGIIFLTMLLGVHLTTGLNNYLLFHSIAEFFSIFIAITTFIIVINCRSLVVNKYVVTIGLSYLFIGIIDTLHTLSYKGMGVFPSYDYYAPQFWIAARYLESISMLGAFAFLGTDRRVNVPLLVSGLALVTAGITLSILYFRNFPVCFVPGHGLTPFKIISEYIICTIFFVDIFIIYSRRIFFDERVYHLIKWSMILMIVMELCFTLYISDAMSDAANEMGHLLKICAFYLVYKAIVVTSLRDPISLLFRDLKASEESLLEAQRLARLGRWEWAVETREWTWQGEALRLLDISESAKHSLDDILDALLPQDRLPLRHALQRATEDGTPFELLLHFAPRSGGMRFAQIRGEALRNRNGAVMCIAGTLQDITINQFSIDNAEDAVAWLTPAGRFAYANKAACLLVGYPLEELLSLTVFELNRTVSQERFAEQWAELKEKGALRFETEFRRKDGSLVPVEICENHLVYAGDEYNVIFARDMTAHKVAETKITRLKDIYAALSYTNQSILYCQERQELFETVVRIAVEYGHFSLAWIGLIDDRTQLIRPIASAGDCCGYLDGLTMPASTDTLYGQGPMGGCVCTGEFVVLNDLIHSPISSALAERQTRYGFQAAAAFPIKNQGRTVGALALYAGVVNFFTDDLIHLLREMSMDISSAIDRFDLLAANQRQEEELRQAVGSLTASNMELERFAYIASHDLQEPLRTIVSFMQLIEREIATLLPAQEREYFDFVIKAAKQMRRMILDLQAYSRINAKVVPFSRVSLQRACASAIDNLQETILESGAMVEVGDLPEVMGDSIQLMQLFQNMISNGIKFRQAGQLPQIIISASRENSEWVVSVQDNGIGIADTSQDIFEIFRRLHASGNYPGSGVGLAICKRIVERHKGRIWFEPAPGCGTLFHFALPIEAKKAGFSPAPRQEPGAPGPP